MIQVFPKENLFIRKTNLLIEGRLEGNAKRNHYYFSKGGVDYV